VLTSILELVARHRGRHHLAAERQVPPPQLGAGDRVRHELRLAVERHHVAALARDHHVAPQVDER